MDANLETLIGRGDLCLTPFVGFIFLVEVGGKTVCEGQEVGNGMGLVKVVKSQKI